MLNPLLAVFQNATVVLSGVDYLIENISRDLEFADDGFAT
ncbi:hypothetical protein Tco_0709510, partial [Tanacetum coccineum]